jgi:hypothetical protein
MVRMQKTIERYYKYAKGGHTNNTDVEQYMQVGLFLGIKEYILCDIIEEKIVGMKKIILPIFVGRKFTNLKPKVHSHSHKRKNKS